MARFWLQLGPWLLGLAVLSSCGGGGTKAAFNHGKKACRSGVPAVVIENARINPRVRPDFAQDLRNYVHRTLPNDDYDSAFKGCVDAVWSKELGERPKP
jgi:hypothetical protein